MVCRLCGGQQLLPFLSRGKAFARCPRCGYVGRSARDFPSREAEAARYRLHNNSLADAGYRAFLQAFIDRAILPHAAPGARILDFGSGPEPALASLLAEAGFAVTAYDPHFRPDRAWRKGGFDLIALHEVAEHLRRPRSCFRGLAARLTPGGILAIRTRFLPEKEGDFEAWWYREDPTHLGFFARESFGILAADLGLELLPLHEPDTALLRLGPGGKRAAEKRDEGL